ncbi:cyclic nucleotide-binding domain-containing protein [Mongoliitalea daihaiensis]|uniref:cyclic nucleotide-binding domain-containing protein n=1 Tax=Mongoliitalea daihaiensis TaxID=2782006 RepID=UPI001F306B55|nr:cyclic nucleotide-binding domain-containing protein [Mongoliitalea daihaiensis]UJP65824.1 Crp/Fnr family transcriptional regulator [Mongoliitalea daihaiensis]
MRGKCRILLLKKYFDHLIKIDEKIYFELDKYLIKRSYKKGSFIKKPGEVDRYARFICTGFVSKQWPSKKGRNYRLRIFSPGQVASDFSSYFNDVPHDFSLKSITYCSTFELEKSLESQLLKEVPEIIPLASLINRRILMESIQWYQIFSMNREDGIKNLKENFSQVLNFFSDKDLGFLFKCSEYTIKKLKRNQFG